MICIYSLGLAGVEMVLLKVLRMRPKYSIMMNIPFEVVIDYNSKIFVVVSSANRHTSDVISCRG